MPKTLKEIGAEGILYRSELKELNAGVRRVYELMKDGAWHSAREIKYAAGTNGQPADEGLRRMRELRPYFTIERRRQPTNARLFEYRLVEKARLSTQLRLIK